MKQIWKHPFWQAGTATLIMGAFMALSDYWLSKRGFSWDQFAFEPEAFTYFCEEATLTDLFRHKVNTFTNLGYFWASAWMIINAIQDKRKGGKTYLRRHPEWSLLMGLACLMVFMGSTLFHAGLTIWTEWADLAGVYAVALSITVLNLHRIQGLWFRKHTRAWPFVILWVLLWAAACATIFQIRSWYLVLGAFSFIALGGLAIMLFTRSQGAWIWLGLGMLLTVLAVMFFAFDVHRIGCDPRAWVQPHGNWHLCGAASFMLYYRFIRSSTAQHAAL